MANTMSFSKIGGLKPSQACPVARSGASIQAPIRGVMAKASLANGAFRTSPSHVSISRRASSLSRRASTIVCAAKPHKVALLGASLQSMPASQIHELITSLRGNTNNGTATQPAPSKDRCNPRLGYKPNYHFSKQDSRPSSKTEDGLYSASKWKQHPLLFPPSKKASIPVDLLH
jgi:hypothetical protein